MKTVKRDNVDSTGRPWKAQYIIQTDTARKNNGLSGYPQARNGRSAPGRRMRNTMTHETAKLENRVTVKPAYCWIWSTLPERIMNEVTTP
jgi:hypothetical protein